MDDQRKMNGDRVGRYLTLTLAIAIVLMIVISLILSAVENGSIGWLIGFVIGGVLLVVFTLDRLSVIHHRLTEARAINRATKFERLHDGTFMMSFDNTPATATVIETRAIGAGDPTPGPPLGDQLIGDARITALLTDARRPAALALLAATVKHRDCGPNATKLLTEAQAKATGLFGGSTFGQAVDYLRDYYRVYTVTDQGRDNGTFIEGGRVVSDVILETAMHSLPVGSEVKAMKRPPARK